MAPFYSPQAVISGFKERIEATTMQGTCYVSLREYLAHRTCLQMESFTWEPQSAVSVCTILTPNTAGLDVKKGISRKPIEQMVYVPDVASLAVLSDAIVTLYPVPSFAPPTLLPKTKTAFSLALYRTVDSIDAPRAASPTSAKAPNVSAAVTYLAVGCRRKLVIYSWKDGEAQDVLETTLPHSPRTMVFMNGDQICLGYSPTEYVLYSLKLRSTTEIATPGHAPTASSSIGGMGMGALTGLGGYIGLGAKAKPSALRMSDKECLVAKENNGVFVGKDGLPSRTFAVDWPAPPEDIAFVQPYIFTALPPGSVPVSQIEGGSTVAGASNFMPSSVIEIRSSISLQPSQTLPLPFAPPPSTIAGAAPPVHTARLLTTSPSPKSPLFLVTTPTDRATVASMGSTVWSFHMKPWEEQVDELAEAGSYADALAFLDSIDRILLPDKDARIRVVRGLNAVAQFRAGQYADAMNTFLELKINPAKVIALYPESISGRLAVPEDGWIELFGGPVKPQSKPEAVPTTEEEGKEPGTETTPADTTAAALPRPPSPQGSVRGLLRSGLESLRPGFRRDDELETASAKAKKQDFQFRKSIEELMRYLSDHRPKVAGALEVLHITTAQAHQMPYLSATSKEDLFALPDTPLPSLTPEQLVRFAQIVDTALFKCYLLVRPGLLASLCRVGNWCEVSEVEQVLMERERFSELIYLYNGKKMHGKALDLLKRLSEKETDMRDKLMPLVNYLQRLGPEHLDMIFEHSRWVFEHDVDIGFEIFTSEEVELPRQLVADFLESIDPAICARFLEHLIDEKGDESAFFHNRLAELYLKMTIAAKKRGNNGERQAIKAKFLNFIDTTNHYETDRLFGLLPSEDLFEAKAILLGRLGRHDAALEIYVYRLQDFLKAEEYCKRVYKPGTPTGKIFLTLLRIYLQPTVKTNIDLLTPALDLIARHSPRLDEVETLQILPPLVPAQDVQRFLIEALRAPIFDTRVVREVNKARDEQVARRLMYLQSKRVKVTDSRMQVCPECHKRIGHSVIAVHAPHGEVTHYQCRDAFARKLRTVRT
ncbi:uncharacterized protein PHACADRAFT_171437 [Phanerochaete carnosa HHB-10118-sp]|uniref:CNH domain-containing protein n=1 Tax=Phanerochaete carnosa (strain HHB-10118-sp) TaxID=650164 RepID=K5V660_PHACS|nr:uncharacterized protein PHACADRAFT_171437 [Phanerochaete carnosa HHB-10118-sp]EKM58191.1 hypothetical protein PHACADRAFT_171437 [Phanerochaete carnosa HHB-10118-sp]